MIITRFCGTFVQIKPNNLIFSEFFSHLHILSYAILAKKTIFLNDFAKIVCVFRIHSFTIPPGS